MIPSCLQQWVLNFNKHENSLDAGFIHHCLISEVWVGITWEFIPLSSSWIMLLKLMLWSADPNWRTYSYTVRFKDLDLAVQDFCSSPSLFASPVWSLIHKSFALVQWNALQSLHLVCSLHCIWFTVPPFPSPLLSPLLPSSMHPTPSLLNFLLRPKSYLWGFKNYLHLYLHYLCSEPLKFLAWIPVSSIVQSIPPSQC